MSENPEPTIEMYPIQHEPVIRFTTFFDGEQSGIDLMVALEIPVEMGNGIVSTQLAFETLLDVMNRAKMLGLKPRSKLASMGIAQPTQSQPPQRTPEPQQPQPPQQPQHPQQQGEQAYSVKSIEPAFTTKGEFCVRCRLDAPKFAKWGVMAYEEVVPAHLIEWLTQNLHPGSQYEAPDGMKNVVLEEYGSGKFKVSKFV